MPKHYYLTQYCPSYYSKGINKKHDKNHLHQIHAAHTSHRYRFRKPRKPLFLIVVLLMIMVIILVSWIYYFRYENSADKRIQAFSEAMRYKDKEQLTSLVTSNHQPLTDEEAVAYFALIQTMGGSDRYMKQIKSAIHQLDQNEATSKDINIDGVTILTINKKTQLYGYIKEFQFEIPQFRFILDAKDNGELTYQLNDKKHEIRLVKGHIVSLEAVPLGEYKLKATKKVGNRTYDGHVVLSLKQYGTMAKEDFSEKRFKVTTKNSYMFKKVELVLNDKHVGRVKDYITYGPYSGEEDLLVYGVGYIGNQSFKSNEVNVPSINSDESPVNVVLKFNESEIFSQTRTKDNHGMTKNK
ncbi:MULTISPECIES: TcaA second domain-containing protein [Staphylococcus]|nr:MULTISPECIES: hypothetical protein [Staphylococcus]AXV41412.1 teicoplanin resistance associated membrane protein TcaA protein [Staphylococcus sp. M0911]MCI2789444.1 hypothetical protein [Staphylococcus warneri]MDU9352267.1 hypothetical protein [Staphylococcus warneri]